MDPMSSKLSIAKKLCMVEQKFVTEVDRHIKVIYLDD